jgi:hypothetical protein
VAGPRPGSDLAGKYEAKAAAEAAEADAADPTGAAAGRSGPSSAAVLVIKGQAPVTSPGTGDPDIADSPLSAAEAEAVSRALGALGLPADDLAALGLLAEGERRAPDPSAAERRLALAVEACDPAWVVALDLEAGEVAAAVIGLKGLQPGVPHLDAGRVWLVVDGLEASLDDPERKRRVWAQLKALGEVRPEGVPAPPPPKAPGAGT